MYPNLKAQSGPYLLCTECALFSGDVKFSKCEEDLKIQDRWKHSTQDITWTWHVYGYFSVSFSVNMI
jgi:hypothetical protein